MHITRICALVVLALFPCACSSSEEPEGSTPAGSPGVTVQVPSVEGDVTLAQFCPTYDQLTCLANTSCCTSGSRFSTVDECLKASPCAGALQGVLSSPLLASGDITYDPKEGGDYLRAMAGSVATCGAVQQASPLDRGVFKGARAQGADCAAGADAALACGPGLRCVTSEDADGKPTGSCQPAEKASPPNRALGEACEGGNECQSGRCDSNGTCAARVAVGEACLEASDCVSGLCHDGAGADCRGSGCACVAAHEAYCSQPLPETPANADWSSPTELCIYAHNSKNSGSSGLIYLGWVYSHVRYECTFTSISSGETKCCTPAVSTSYTLVSDTAFGVHSDSTDGLRVSSFIVKKGSSNWTIETVRDFDPGLDCEGCTLGTDCNSCWIDADGHDNCKGVTVQFEGTHTATCGYNW